MVSESVTKLGGVINEAAIERGQCSMLGAPRETLRWKLQQIRATFQLSPEHVFKVLDSSGPIHFNTSMSRYANVLVSQGLETFYYRATVVSNVVVDARQSSVNKSENVRIGC